MFSIILSTILFAFPPKDLNQIQVPLYKIASQHLTKTRIKKTLDTHWGLNDFFGVICVINDSSNTEGLASIKKELHAIGVKDFEVFPSLEGNQLDGNIQKKFSGDQLMEAGRYMTHYRLLQGIKKRFDQAVLEYYKAHETNDEQNLLQAKVNLQKYSRVLVLKDNVCFNKGLGKVLQESFQDIPEPWDMIYFFCQTYEPTEPISPLVQRINKSYYDVAYAVNFRMYGPLVHHLKQVEDPEVLDIRHIDHQISHIHKQYNVYSFLTPFVYLK